MDYRIRKRLRLDNYDYSQSGAYFVTVCTKNKVCLFWQQHNKYQPIEPDSPVVGAVIGRPNKKIHLSEYGKYVKESLNNIHTHYPMVYVDKYVIMPNHIHIILRIDKGFQNSNEQYGGRPMTAPTVSWVINHMKGYVSKQIGFSPWQRSFNDRVIRNRNEYAAYWQHIENNPADWENDELFCSPPLHKTAHKHK